MCPRGHMNTVDITKNSTAYSLGLFICSSMVTTRRQGRLWVNWTRSVQVKDSGWFSSWRGQSEETPRERRTSRRTGNKVIPFLCTSSESRLLGDACRTKRDVSSAGGEAGAGDGRSRDDPNQSAVCVSASSSRRTPRVPSKLETHISGDEATNAPFLQYHVSRLYIV